MESDEWITAAEAVRLLKPVFDGSASSAHMTICGHAHAGLIRTRARQFIVTRFSPRRFEAANEVQENYEIPAEFWWAKGHAALIQNWTIGYFETWIDDRIHQQAFSVSFWRAHIKAIVPAAAPAAAPDIADAPEPEYWIIPDDEPAGGQVRRRVWRSLVQLYPDKKIPKRISAQSLANRMKPSVSRETILRALGRKSS